MSDKKGFSKDKLIKGGAALAAALVAAIFGGKSLLSDDKPDETEKQSPTAVVTEAPKETNAPDDEKPAGTDAPETKAPETETPETKAPETEASETEPEIEYINYTFYSNELLESHFDKHGHELGDEFGYDTAEDYEKGASDVINDPDALYKTEKEDGDGVYYIPDTNEFVVLSTSGYIRTYFLPTDGIDYFERQ